MKFILFIVTIFYSAGANAEISYPYPTDTQVRLQSDETSLALKGQLQVINPGENIWLIQAWGEDENRKKHPVIFPAISRIEKYGNVLLKIYPETVGKKEIKWFVVKIIPATKKEQHNRLSIPVVYRLKLIR
ncbi:fimbria/pilus periplasmic chaperone [Escherichia albertii]